MAGLPPDFDTRFNQALAALYAEPSVLTDTTERAVVGRLAVHLDHAFADLTEEFPEHPRVWDVEYMRAGDLAKSFRPIGPRTDAPALTPRLLAPDLVWHRRLLDQRPPLEATNDANLAVVEVKLRASGAGMLTDKAKLRLLTGLETHVERWQRDLRCPGDPPPGGDQKHYGWVDMPPPPAGLAAVPPYEVGISLNIFPSHVRAIEYHRGRTYAGQWEVEY